MNTANQLDEKEIVKNFLTLNKLMPGEYLRRNHIQYKYVCYLSLIGTLFISKHYDFVGRIVCRAYHYLETTDDKCIYNEYFNESRLYLKKIKDYLIDNKLLTNELTLKELIAIK